MICLDTSVIIGCLRGRPPVLAERLERELLAGDFVLPTIVLFELQYGIAKSARPQDNAKRLATFLELPIAILPFEPGDGDEAGNIRAALERAGTLRYPDCSAGTPAWRDAGDGHLREFARVPRLKTDDWTAA